jgi:hypothetical protein
MIVASDGHYLLFHVVDEIDDWETHLVVDLALAGDALDALAVSFINMLDALPGAFQAHKTEFKTGIEQEAALLLDENLIEEMLDELEDEYGGLPVMADLLTGQQFHPDMDIAVLSGVDLGFLLAKFGKTALDEWEHSYNAQIVLRPDETGHGVFLFPEIQAEGLRESRATGAFVPCHHALHGNAGYWKWSDIKRKIPTISQ